MATNGYGPTPVPGHIGRIPNFGKTHVNPMGNVEPPACIQNAMMTKDKKPFTYTPGGLDLSQIRTPSMARRMARQRSLEEQEQAYGGHHGAPNHQSQGGGPVPPPPPPPPSIPAPPPPPPLIIEAPNNTTSKPVALGERPEIVIPENPIGMLRKTNSPYHWEAEKADMQRMGPVPKFVEKVPSPLTVKLPQNPQNYSKQFSNTIQPNQSPGSPLYKPEALYAPNSGSPGANGTPPMREMLVRQDSQFNKSPQPFANQSPLSNNSTYSPTPNNHWKQPDKRDSEVSGNSPQSPQWNRGPFSPNVTQTAPGYQNSPPNPSVYHTLPQAGQRNQDNVMNNNNTNMMNNNNIMSTRNNYENMNESQQSPNVNPSNPAPWRANTINRHPRDNQMSNNNNQPPTQQAYSPPWKRDNSYNPVDNNNVGRPEIKHSPNQLGNQQEYIPPWVAQDNNNNKVPNSNVPWRPYESPRNTPPTSPPENRYQSSISIPVTPKKQPPQPQFNNSPSQREAVYVNQEPVYYCPDSSKSIPPWVKTQKEKTKTPPPAWCQKPLDGRRSAPRELVTPPRETNAEPEWVRKSNEMQRGAREIISPPKYQQPVQPNWSTLPSENRKSVPKDSTQGSRIIPIQMEVSSTENRNQGRQSNSQPQLRIVIDMQQNPNSENQSRTQAPYSQPTQRIMRVLSPQLVRMDEGPDHQDLPSLNRSFQMNQDSQPKTRIIPIQIESNGNGGANKSFGGRY